MDFLSGFPTTFCKHDAIWVAVCHFSKMALFIPCHKTTFAAQTTKLFFHDIWTHFGLPSSIVFDRDSRFLSTFWGTLWSLLCCQLHFSTTFHPQTDGKTEVVNRTLVHSLCSYFSKNKQWDTYLHIIQHSYNRATHSSNGFLHPHRCLLISLLLALHINNRNNSQPNLLFTIYLNAILR